MFTFGCCCAGGPQMTSELDVPPVTCEQTYIGVKSRD